MGIRLIADSCCDTGPQTDERLRDLSKAPLQVLVEEQAFVDDGTSHLEELIAAMKASRQAARSACPGPEDFACRIRGADDCLVITLSSKLSGSYNAARNARDLVLEDEPGKRIHILDSASASAGETRLALFAQACLDAGNDFDTAVRRAESFAAGMRTLFVLEDLSALVKSGGLNKVAGSVASILSLCPVLGADGHGEIKMVAKARGMQNALRRLTEIVGQETAGAPPRSVTMVLAHCQAEERAESLKMQLKASCPAIGKVLMVPTGILSTMYVGNGGIVVAF